MKLITLKKEKNSLTIKLNKKSYKGKTFVILPREDGYFSSKRIEEEKYFVLCYNTKDREIEVFNFSNMGDLNKAIEEIEKALLRDKKSWSNIYIKGCVAVFLTLSVVSLPLIVFQVWKDYQINNEVLRVKLDMTRQMNVKGNADETNTQNQQQLYEMLKQYENKKSQNSGSSMIDNQKTDIIKKEVELQSKSDNLPSSEQKNEKIQPEIPSIQDQLNSLKENRNK